MESEQLFPLVSVIIPTFNYGHVICDAVDSVLAQVYPNIEVIVVDDGSTDDTRERLAKYGERIRYHYQPNAGLSAARNTGIGLAKGELVALLDSDDAFHPEKVAYQVEYLAANGEVGLVATTKFSDEPRTWPQLNREQTSVQSSRVSLRDVVIRAPFAPSSVLIRRECFDKVGLFDVALRSAEDRDMWIRIAAHYPMALMQLPLTWYRQTPGSMSRNAEKMEYFERAVITKAFQMSELKGRWILRRQADGLALMAASRRYQDDKKFRVAFARLFESLIAWPFPYWDVARPRPTGRITRLLVLLRQSTGLQRLWRRKSQIASPI